MFSTPGDGSFVRQWWYDQQSAEDQALIDSGELEYPKPYQAENFVDTFDLDLTTKLTLSSNGNIRTSGREYNYFYNTTGNVALNPDGSGLAIGWNDGSGSRETNFINLSGQDTNELKVQGGFKFQSIAKDGTESPQVRFFGTGDVGIGDVVVPAARLEVKQAVSADVTDGEGLRVRSLFQGGDTVKIDNYVGVKVSGNLSEHTDGTYAQIDSFNHYLCSNTSFANGVRNATCYNTGIVSLKGDPAGLEQSKAYGFYSNIAEQSGNLNDGTTPAFIKYNFYAANNAPNFFTGDTYIGGNTSRNTFELWKSTLTEEQLEQLEAGTLAIPANVSTTGDGSFVRQWWYDQQDAETQAELDAGTLEYPEHLAATTFTDTFDLGDNTAINLLSNGIIQNSGIQFLTSKTSGSVESRGIVYSSTKKALLCTNNPNNTGDNVDAFLARTDNTQWEDDGSRTPINIARGTSFKAESPLGNAAGEYGSYDSYVGFHATDPGNTNNDAVWTGDDNSYGFLSGLADRTGTGGGKAYAFYAAGNAPNYFKGAVNGGGPDGENAAWSIASNGTATGITVTRAAVVTDEQAGTVETLLDIITDLRTRLAALEADHATLMGNSNGGY